MRFKDRMLEEVEQAPVIIKTDYSANAVDTIISANSSMENRGPRQFLSKARLL